MNPGILIHIMDRVHPILRKIAEVFHLPPEHLYTFRINGPREVRYAV